MNGNEHVGKLIEFYSCFPLEGLEERLTELDQDVEHAQRTVDESILVRLALAAAIERKKDA